MKIFELLVSSVLQYFCYMAQNAVHLKCTENVSQEPAEWCYQDLRLLPWRIFLLLWQYPQEKHDVSKDQYILQHPRLTLVRNVGKKVMQPFSLSTRITTTTSLRPTRISLLMERIRRRLNSESKIIPAKQEAEAERVHKKSTWCWMCTFDSIIFLQIHICSHFLDGTNVCKHNLLDFG